MLEGFFEKQGALMQQINYSYPSVLTSIVNNDLRISLRDEETLNKLIKKYSELTFTPVIPSFEEVFIGLM